MPSARSRKTVSYHPSSQKSGEMNVILFFRDNCNSCVSLNSDSQKDSVTASIVTLLNRSNTNHRQSVIDYYQYHSDTSTCNTNSNNSLLKSTTIQVYCPEDKNIDTVTKLSHIVAFYVDKRRLCRHIGKS